MHILPIIPGDVSAFHWIRYWTANRFLQTFFQIVTQLGDGLLSLIVAAIAWIHEFYIQRRKTGLSGLIFWTWLIAGLLVVAIKPVVARQRPLTLERNSFPSGHTATISALATALTLYWPRYAGFFWIIATLVGFSRIAVGAHYPVDVLAGGLVGVFSVLLYCRLFEYHASAAA